MTDHLLENVFVQKITSLQRCVARARSLRGRAGNDFADNFDLQDAAVLNVLRACETSIDLANMLLRRERLGIPSESREAFGILARERRIDAGLSMRLQKMVGFRNVAVHQYQALASEIIVDVIDAGLDDLLTFADIIRKSLTQ